MKNIYFALIVFFASIVNGQNFSTSMMENIKLMYNEAGLKSMWRKPYPVPHILFWNLRSSVLEGSPAQSTDDGVGLVSGFSPALMKAVLAVEQFKPIDLMMEAIKGINVDTTNLPEKIRDNIYYKAPDDYGQLTETIGETLGFHEDEWCF